MDSIDLKGFRSANNLTQADLGEFLGVQKAFISRIENGRDKLPASKLRKLISNGKGWNTAMLVATTPGVMVSPVTPKTKLLDIVPKQDTSHTSYLQRKVDDQEKLIRELYKEIGMLQAKLDLIANGDVGGVVVSTLPKEEI